MNDSPTIPTDPYAGQGGSYVVQPDGTHTLRERTEPPPERRLASTHPDDPEPEPVLLLVPEGESSSKPVPRRQKPALTEMPVRKADSADAAEPTPTHPALETDHVPGV